jgi:hypothetical protein
MTINDLKAITPKPILWHYTNFNGLSGILSSGELWLTHIAMQNDIMEQQEAIEVFMQEIKKTSTITQKTEDLLHFFGESRVCTMSFSENRDLLSQWRGYGSPGNGFAIGFDSNVLKQIAVDNDADLLPCVYKRDEKKDLIKEYIQNQNFSQINVMSIFAAMQIANTFPLIGSIIKSEAFKEENEWRLVKYRKVEAKKGTPYSIMVGGNAKTYWKIDISTKPIQEIVMHVICGPSSDYENIRKRVIEMLLYAGFKSVPNDESIVSPSMIPLR